MSLESNINKLRTITICSGKGGVGKSVLTANLAASVADNGSNVFILDSVRDLPNQQIIFGVEPPIRLSSVMSGKVDLKAALYNVRENTSLLVDSPFEIDDNQEIVCDLNDIVTAAKKLDLYDYLFIDTPTGLSDQLISFCYMSDLVIILITDEPTSLLDAYGLVKVLVNYIKPEKIALLVNNVIDSEDATEVSQKLNMATNQFLNINLDVLGFVPYSRSVRLSIQRQELLTDIFAEDDAAISVREIASIIESKYFGNININTNIDFQLNKA